MTTEPHEGCADCGLSSAAEPSMYNTRETWRRDANGRPITERKPGYLCVQCWELANPVVSNVIRKRTWYHEPFTLGLLIYCTVMVGSILIASFTAICN